MKRSEDGINIIRCVGLLLVFGFHYYLYNGYYGQPQQGGWMLFANVQRALFLSCNGLYMMLTGYLKSDKPINRHYFKCILTAIVTYIIAASISIPVRHFFLDQKRSFVEWRDMFLDYSGVYYGWYVKMYIGLILISPILNTCVKNIEDNKMLLLMTGLLIIATSFSPATEYSIYPTYWEIAYPLSYYMIGATIKKLKPKIKARWLVIIIALSAFGTGTVTLLSTDKTLKEATKWEFGAIWIMLIGVSIFLMLYRIKLPKIASKLVAFIANGAFPAYMLSNLTDAWIYKLNLAWQNPNHYFIAFLLLTIPSYIMWVLIGNLISVIVGRITSITFFKKRKII